MYKRQPEGDWFSAVVPSDGSYGIDKGLMFSFPVVSDGQGLSLIHISEPTRPY